MKQVKFTIQAECEHKPYHQVWNLVRDNVESKVRDKSHNFIWQPIRAEINFTLLDQFIL